MAKKITKVKSKDDKRLDKIEELQDQLEEELEAEDERSERVDKARERSLELAKLGAEKLKGGAGGFMKFIREQNVVGLAVGLVLGTAAGGLVNSLIDNIIMPPLGFLLGSADGLKGLELNMGVTPSGEVAILHYGVFINDLINFLVLALCVYLVIKILKLDIKK
ncbi:MscL family protein [Candidatus Saccharibacteria bacterium]|nr:MscL family protein [Candidatus Saccharibacteria bacterium]